MEVCIFKLINERLFFYLMKFIFLLNKINKNKLAYISIISQEVYSQSHLSKKFGKVLNSYYNVLFHLTDASTL